MEKNFTQQSSGISSSYTSRLAHHSKSMESIAHQQTKKEKKNPKIITTDAAKAFDKCLKLNMHSRLKISENLK